MKLKLTPRFGATLLVGLMLLWLTGNAWAQQAGIPALTSAPGPGNSTTYSVSIQTLLVISALSFLPAVLLLMTGFTRIVSVL